MEARVRGLKAKRVLITGGASGIGVATAVRFLEEGSVVCVLDRDAKARTNILQELPSLTGALDADVSNLKQVQAAFVEAIRLMGGVDVLINNAGISIRHNFLDITPEEWDKVIAVNLTGVFYVAQTAARRLLFNSARDPHSLLFYQLSSFAKRRTSCTEARVHEVFRFAQDDNSI
jgi:meso-butanediol dehydrogenase/(S,S)-butanediol dehydrogenase/diacetyl reductase